MRLHLRLYPQSTPRSVASPDACVLRACALCFFKSSTPAPRRCSHSRLPGLISPFSR